MFFAKLKSILFGLLISSVAWFTAGSVWLFWRFYGAEEKIPYASTFAEVLRLDLIASILVGTSYFVVNKLLDTVGKLRGIRPISIIFIRTLCILIIGMGNVLLVAAFSALSTKETVLVEFQNLIIGNPLAFKFLVYLLYISFLFNTILEFQKMFGEKMAMKIALGYYKKPRYDNLIFAFIDLNDFTTIVEEKGHGHTALLLQDCFSILEKNMVKSQGSIYTFIGDAAIVYWSLRTGIRKGRFLSGIFQFFSDIEKSKELFLEKYGSVPNFKAGIAVGEVIIKEIGREKKEIIYLGDVLNISSRLLGLQKKLGMNPLAEKVFVTADTLNLLEALPKPLVSQRLGKMHLKGKKTNIDVYLIKNSAHAET